MKNFSKISALILAATLLSACQTPTTTTVKQDTSYTNKDLGIKFDYYYTDAPYYGTAKQEVNKIVFQDPMVQNPESSYIAPYFEVLSKKTNQRVEDAILEAVKKKGKDETKCITTNEGPYWAKPNFQVYKLNLAESAITYTDEEQKEIKKADAESKIDGGPFDGTFQKQVIYNHRRVATCSDYANNPPMGTSKTSPGIFLYDEKASTTKFLFIPWSPNPYFFKENSLEILK